jgi:hypothetical protein
MQLKPSLRRADSQQNFTIYQHIGPMFVALWISRATQNRVSGGKILDHA